MRPYLEKSFIKIGLVEWLKVKALSSSPSTANKTKQCLVTPLSQILGYASYVVGQSPHCEVSVLGSISPCFHLEILKYEQGTL
jgi:hypothetical protein